MIFDFGWMITWKWSVVYAKKNQRNLLVFEAKQKYLVDTVVINKIVSGEKYFFMHFDNPWIS